MIFLSSHVFQILTDNFYPGWGSPINNKLLFREESMSLKGRFDRNVDL